MNIKEESEGRRWQGREGELRGVEGRIEEGRGGVGREGKGSPNSPLIVRKRYGQLSAFG